jgi:putative endonuclease
MGLTQVRGARGENLAAAFLRQQGYRILKRNVRTPFGEIDIICREGAMLVFVEVKSRSSKQFGNPEDAVVGKKLERLKKSIEFYVTRQKWNGDYRLDIVTVEKTKNNEECTLIRDVG